LVHSFASSCSFSLTTSSFRAVLGLHICTISKLCWMLWGQTIYLSSVLRLLCYTISGISWTYHFVRGRCYGWDQGRISIILANSKIC
jgi:hypothetical protein